MKSYSLKTAGALFIAGAVLVLVPYTVLVIRFQYPDVLRLPVPDILAAFKAGGSSLIYTWLFFALTGLPLIPAYRLLGKALEQHSVHASWATTIGISGLVVQVIGLLRWTFVVPVLADQFSVGDAATKAAVVVSFQTLHQFAGVLLGEHLGQLFTIIWTVVISAALQRSELVSRWLPLFGYVASAIYLLAQTELLAIVIPGFPMASWAGFGGSLLWLLWLILLGVKLWLRRFGMHPKHSPTGNAAVVIQ